jgi:hypothetical protein
MRKTLVIGGIVATVLLTAAASNAQTPVIPGDRLGWDQPAASVAEANAFRYIISLDGQTPLLPTEAVCTGTVSPFLCTVPFPAVIPGVQRSVTVTARKVIDGSTFLDSAVSAPLVFRLEVVPGTPVNLRRVQGENE